MSEQHPLAETMIVRGPFENWRHGRYQALPRTHEMIDWLRMMANLIEHEYVRGFDIRAPIEEVIVGLNEWDALKHGDADLRRIVFQVQYQPEPGVWESFATRDNLEEAEAIVRRQPGMNIIRVTTHRRFVTEGVK